MNDRRKDLNKRMLRTVLVRSNRFDTNIRPPMYGTFSGSWRRKSQHLTGWLRFTVQACSRDWCQRQKRGTTRNSKRLNLSSVMSAASDIPATSPSITEEHSVQSTPSGESKVFITYRFFASDRTLCSFTCQPYEVRTFVLYFFDFHQIRRLVVIITVSDMSCRKKR